ncbi:4925_t:CDS:10 [Dentiscutata erythropus]|uniref:RNA helicase n=1 Tax=Dentiscutata erythropus TaxID=1348616 RepID=A0A9N8YXQ4_9GLOM|nr:4925_t:CDS:10 [Dentiscutata erythropus]
MEASTKKMSSKKKKRFEKYVQKKNKKEERVALLEKLSKSSFSSELMKSSKNLGRGKDTMKERLRRAFYEKRLGIAQSDPDVPLFVNNDGDNDTDEDNVNGGNVDEGNVDEGNVDEGSIDEGSVDETLNNHMNTDARTSNLPIQKECTKPKADQYAQNTIIGCALKRGPDDDSFDSSDSQCDVDKKIVSNDSPNSVIENQALLGTTSCGKKQSFKEWATEQLGIGFKSSQHIDTASSYTQLSSENTENFQKKCVNLSEQATPKFDIQDGIDITVDSCIENNGSKNNITHVPKHAKKAFNVPVKRSQEIQLTRMELPVCEDEQAIMETINENSVVIICGETGSGKTTQLPQFLYEAGFGNPESDNPGIIGITQPRRVAAMSMSKRVAQELSLDDQRVSYQIRYDATVSSKTVIKFMTDGVLLRELSGDFLLSKYSAIIIDEAHERSLNTDILIGVISRVLRLRKELSEEDKSKIKPLKIIIMSATLRISDFTQNRRLFDILPPVINVNARQYPVSIHFNKRTPRIDYVTEAFRKVCKIHTRLPRGGILVFMTGQNEISTLCKKLRNKFPYISSDRTHRNRAAIKEETPIDELNEYIHGGHSDRNVDCEIEELVIGENDQDYLDHYDDFDTDSEDSITEFENDGLDNEYGLLSQLRLLFVEIEFDHPPPEGTRLCVVATNVAETSLTIPGVTYVVDCGKVKERCYNASTGVQSYVIDWISKASADQRAGRAGRTGPGHCYRLYSSAVFNDQFQQFTVPEIHRTPIEGVILQMKAMNIDTVSNFPFPTPPDRDQLKKAETLLRYIGALNENSQITSLGRAMATFPLTPRFSKMLIIGQQHECLPYVIAIVSALSVGDPFIKDYHIDGTDSDDESDKGELEDYVQTKELNEIQKEVIFKKERRKLMRKKFYDVQKRHSGLDPTSDILKFLNVVGAYEYSGGSEKFCEDNFVRIKAMQEIHKLRGQITNIVQTNCQGVDVYVDPKMKPPSAIQLEALRQIIAAGFIDQVAIRKDLVDGTTKAFSSTRGISYSTMWTDEDVFIHPSSVLYHGKPPDFVVFQELQRTNKVWMKGITIIKPEWLPKLGKSLCVFSKPKELPAPKLRRNDDEMTAYVTPCFGPKSWELPPIKVKGVKAGGRWVPPQSYQMVIFQNGAQNPIKNSPTEAFYEIFNKSRDYKEQDTSLMGRASD